MKGASSIYVSPDKSLRLIAIRNSGVASFPGATLLALCSSCLLPDNIELHHKVYCTIPVSADCLGARLCAALGSSSLTTMTFFHAFAVTILWINTVSQAAYFSNSSTARPTFKSTLTAIVPLAQTSTIIEPRKSSTGSASTVSKNVTEIWDSLPFCNTSGSTVAALGTIGTGSVYASECLSAAWTYWSAYESFVKTASTVVEKITSTYTFEMYTEIPPSRYSTYVDCDGAIRYTLSQRSTSTQVQSLWIRAL